MFKTKAIAFILDIGLPNIEALKQKLMPAFANLELGDRMVLYEGKSIAVCDYHSASGVIGNYVAAKFDIHKAILQTATLVLTEDINEDVYFYIITDNEPYGIELTIKQCLSYNINFKSYQFNIWEIGGSNEETSIDSFIEYKHFNNVKEVEFFMT